MKQLKLFFALFAMLALGVGNAWAETATLTFSAKCGGKGTDTQGYNWTITSDGTESNFDSTKGIHYGTSSAKVKYIRLSTSDIPGTITEVKVNASTASGVTANLTVKVGSSDFTTDNSVTSQKLSTSATEYTFSGSASGEIIVEISKSSSATKAIYCKSVVVTYKTSGNEETVLSVTPENITWEGVAASAEKSEEITITLSNIETVTATLSGEKPSAFSIDKNSLEASGKIVVSKNITTIGTYAAKLTITDAGTQTKTVTLYMEVVADPEPTGTFERFTGTLEEGDYVLVANGTTDALKNTITSNRFDCGTVEVAEDKIVNPDKSVIWHIAANDKYWTMYNEFATKYAGGTTSKNQGALLDDVTDLAKWTITVDGEGVYTFENYGRSLQTSDSGNKFLSKNNQNAYWATYASGQKNPVLYKKSDGKQPAGLVYETNKYRTKLGDSFVTPTLTNPNSLNVTYSSSNNDVAEVATDGSVTIKAVGGVEITATFAGSETHRQGSAKYTICVTEHAGTQADPYSVADARRVIDVMETAEGVYATGIVSEIVTAYNSTYGNISYNISADGLTTSDQLQAYRGKSYDGANFTSADDVKVGDEVVIKGTLKKYSTTYEFDENNQLVSLNRTKEQAGLAYAETEHTANVDEEFAEPALTNPNNLTVTYSSSNTTLATVNATTGEVTILAAGKVTITATTAGDATYAAGSASYNITITNPGLAVATLPFAFNGNKAAIETTAGMTQNGLGSDYSTSTAPNSQLKFDGTGDWVVIRFDSEPEKLSYDIKNNSFSGGKFSVQESADGETYTDVEVHTEITNTQNEEHTLLSTSRHVKFIYTEKVDGNVGLGNIKITEPDDRADAGLAWNPTSVTLTQGEAFTAPTLNNPNSVSDISYESSNDEVATVTTAGVIALASAIGTATITATFAGDGTYKPATATCTIIVNEYIETIDGEWQLVTDASKLQAGMEIIIASVADAGTVKTMGEQGNNNRSAVASTVDGDKLNPAVGTTVITLEDCQLYEGLFALKTKVGYLYAAGSSSNKLKSQEGINDNACWTITVTEGVAAVVATRSSNHNIMRYNENSDLFSCYASDQKDIALYAKVPEHSRTTSVGRYGTICLPGNIVKCLGATLYEVAGKDGLRVVFDEVLTPEEGMPYIFLAHNAEVLFYCGDKTAATPGDYKSLHGTFSVLQDEQLKGMYMVQNNKIVKCADTGCGVAEYRAYFDGDELDALGKPGAQMPGRKRITMGTESENTATGTEDVVAPAGQTLKIIENGQLIIIRNGEKFNAQGQKL